MAATNAKVTKTMLIEQLAEKLGISKAQSETFLNAYIEIITKDLKSGKEITITGFGTFKKTKRKARKGRNPQTGKEINIPASVSVTFRTGKTLKEAVQ